MYKKLMFLMIFASLLAWTGNVTGATYTWDHGGADKLWKTAANWSTDTLPTSTDDARILDVSTDKPVIDSAHTGANAARCSNLQIGYNAGETGEVSMTGGELICNSKLLVGYYGNGTFTMSGGSITTTLYDLDIGAAVSGTGSVFNMSGGTVNSARYFYVGHLSTGTFNMSGGLVTATGANTILGQGASSGNYGTINISAGTIDTTGQLIRVGYNTRGIINMTGGKIEAGDVHIPHSDSYAGHGDVNLYGGLINTAAFWMGSNGYMDIAGGTLTITGNVVSTINTYVSAGQIVGFGGSGTVNVSYDTPVAGKTTVTATSTKASSPSPTDTATSVGVTTDLSWSAGSGATSHDVYLGTVWADVNSATTASSLFKGNQAGTTYDTGTMANDTTYYWRIDEVNASTVKGYVWSFTTVVAAPNKATTPSPANSATGVSTTADLSWTAGSGATSHDVYMGTVEADVNSATTSSSVFKGNQGSTTYDPGTMVGNKTYYWRIDEKNGGGTTKGTVWSFTTSAGTPPNKATGPGPADVITGVTTTTDLTWTAGSGATSHNVYLGTSRSAVNNATTASSEYKGNQAGTTYDTGTMSSNIGYYWRIDEKNGAGATKGDVWCFATTQTANLTVENSAYKVVQATNLNMSVKNKDSNTTSAFTTKFTVIYNATQPTLSSASDLTATWTLAGKNLFGTGTNTNLSAASAGILDSNLVWTFTTQTNFDLTASLDLSTDYNEPALRYTLKAKNAGWFMLGYTGAPETDPNTMEKFHQPTMWDDKVIAPPDDNKLVFATEPTFCQEYLCPLPAVMTRDVNGVDCAVVVSPDYQSFRLPHYRNVEFGLCIRNLDGKAQPMIFSPEMGAQEANLPTDKDSYLAVDETHSFGVLLAVDNSEWYDFYKGIVKNIFKFRDQRDNSGPGSLNKLLANITDYAMDADGNNYNMWDSNQKCNEYWTDQPYSFKVLGGLFAINSAIVLDDNEMFWSRSLPQVEYCISREESYFHPYNYNYNLQMSYDNNMLGPWISGLDFGNFVPAHRRSYRCI